MMYDKVLLNEQQLTDLYREPLSLDDNARVILKTAREFQEYLGAIAFSEKDKVISKGKKLEVNLNFPTWLPRREPLLNWFQIALKAENPMLADPLGCKARYKGMLPGNFYIRESTEAPSEFYLEAMPRYAPVNYALFIYDSAEYQAFLDGVGRLLGGYLNHGRTVVSDTLGNKILVSDDSAQPMLLVPISLLIGGKDHVVTTWENLFKGR